MANSLDPDETAHHKPSHLDLHCLQKYVLIYLTERVKGNWYNLKGGNSVEIVLV